MLDLESMNLADLKALAKEQNIKNISKLKKEEIIEVLKQILDTSSTINQDEDDINHYESNENMEEICIPEYRSISELGIGEGTKLIIKPGREPELRVEYRTVYRERPRYSGFGGGALYGCPIAQSVKEAINEAERYSDGDSTISTGFINS